VRALKLSSSPPEDQGASDPQYVFGDRLTWEELYRRLGEGQQVKSAVVDEEVLVREFGELVPGAVALLAIGQGERVRFLQDDSKLQIGEKLFYLAAEDTQQTSPRAEQEAGAN
jgi:hypothetical protein